MIAFLVCIVAPVYFSFQLIYSKTEAFLRNPNQIYEGLKSISVQIKDWTGQDLLSSNIITDVQKRAAGFIPGLLNSSATMLGNLFMILFLSFFMFTNGKEFEKSVAGGIKKGARGAPRSRPDPELNGRKRLKAGGGL
jgi:predicted PurR-regulated permease PerM